MDFSVGSMLPHFIKLITQNEMARLCVGRILKIVKGGDARRRVATGQFVKTGDCHFFGG
jgi:hypothetical protein